MAAWGGRYVGRWAGGRIAFWPGFETESGHIWVMNSDGTGRRQVTFGTLPSGEPLHSDNPAW